jgi:hypothetical protein
MNLLNLVAGVGIGVMLTVPLFVEAASTLKPAGVMLLLALGAFSLMNWVEGLDK